MTQEENRAKNSVIYVNRELSWLKFNTRVLEEAEDETVPLYERLKFVSIFSSNLDEFFMVRVGSLYDQSLVKQPVYENKTNMTPSEQISAICETVREIIPRKDNAYSVIQAELSKRGIKHLNLTALTGEEYHFLRRYFDDEILPLVSPQIIDKHHPFPFLKNKEIYVGVHIENKGSKGDSVKVGIIPASGMFKRVVYVRSESEVKFVLAEDLICFFADRIFRNCKILDKTIFRITRNADVTVEEGLYDHDIDYRTIMTDVLKKRKKLAPVRLELYRSDNIRLMQYLCKKLGLSEHSVFMTTTPLDLSFVYGLESHFPQELKKELSFEPLVPQQSPQINPAEPMIPQILRGDILLHYPFENIGDFIRLLEEAAVDPEVVSVKITLYRVANDSKVINALMKAAENGKDVLVVVELRARFDEENNIDWSKQLEDAGCNVIYGLHEYKVHSKLLLITRRSHNKISYITQIGTGNYNEKTSKLYTDLSLLTANQDIGVDASVVFTNLSIGNKTEYVQNLLVAPLCLKSRIIEMIDGEIAEARSGHEARIFLKMNSLSDKTLIDKLVEASKNGVQIEMFVRGICCMKAGIKGQTENITVKSIVGRYLEHSRIYIFGVGQRQKIYISSADFMTRNTQRRVEVAAPIFSSVAKEKILQIVEALRADNVKARTQLSSGEYIRPTAGEGEPFYDSQIEFYRQAYRAAAKAKNNYPTASKHSKKTSSFWGSVKKLFRSHKK